MRRLEFSAYVATIFACLIAIVQLAMQISIRQSVRQVEQQQTVSRFRVLYPGNGSVVDQVGPVRGTTPYQDRRHFVVVTPMETGDNWIQEEPVSIRSDGSWTGKARYGAIGDFMVRAVATRSRLPPGNLAEVPDDAIFSDATIVTRSK